LRARRQPTTGRQTKRFYQARERAGMPRSSKMSQQKILIPASVAFAALWTAGMYWLNAPKELAGVLILAAAGAIAGGLWYMTMRSWMERHLARR